MKTLKIETDGTQQGTTVKDSEGKSYGTRKVDHQWDKNEVKLRLFLSAEDALDVDEIVGERFPELRGLEGQERKNYLDWWIATLKKAR